MAKMNDVNAYGLIRPSREDLAKRIEVYDSWKADLDQTHQQYLRRAEEVIVSSIYNAGTISAKEVMLQICLAVREFDLRNQKANG